MRVQLDLTGEGRRDVEVTSFRIDRHGVSIVTRATTDPMPLATRETFPWHRINRIVETWVEEEPF